MNNNSGFSVVEILLAAGIFVIVASGAVGVVIKGFTSNRQGAEETIASQFASEGIEAIRSVKNQNYASLINTPSTGIARVSSVWALSGANNVFEKYTRSIGISDHNANTKKITSTVTWNAGGSRNNTTVFDYYATDWKKPFFGNWSTPLQDSALDLLGNQRAFKVQVQGNYAYVVRAAGNPNFQIVDITNSASLLALGSLTLSGNATNIAVLGNYAYVTTTDNNAELVIIDISNPNSPSVAGIGNAAGGADANSVYLVGTTAYVVRSSSADDEFYIWNIADPSNLSLLGSMNNTTEIFDVFVYGNYAYLVTGSDTSEFQIINISNPASLTLTSSVNLAGSDNAISVSGIENYVLVGKAAGSMYIINTTNPASPIISSTFTAGGSINDISISDSGTYTFLATSNTSAELRVVDFSDVTIPVSVGSANLSTAGLGVCYSQTKDRAYIASDADAAELTIIKPQ